MIIREDLKELVWDEQVNSTVEDNIVVKGLTETSWAWQKEYLLLDKFKEKNFQEWMRTEQDLVRSYTCEVVQKGVWMLIHVLKGKAVSTCA